MGFTRYVNGHVAFTDAQWATFAEKCKRIFKKSKVPLANWEGSAGTMPAMTLERVSFNGLEDDSHETCTVLRHADAFTFCKTAGKPYDEVVVAVYKALRDVLPDTKRSSDGGEEVFGKKKSIPIVKAKAVAPAPTKTAPVAAKKPTRKARMEQVYQTVQEIAAAGKLPDIFANRMFDAMVILREEIAVVEKKNKG